MYKPFVSILISTMVILGLASCEKKTDVQDKGKIVFADLSWDSIQVHNRIAGSIVKYGYGYQPDYVISETVPGVLAVMSGEIDVDMESWTENVQDAYDKGIKSGKMLDIGPNYPGAEQGWYIPRYLIEGDPARGIPASAPDLTTVEQLPKYSTLFKDPEVPTKGRIYIGPPGWGVTKLNEEKVKDLGLDTYYNPFLPGSGAALAGSMKADYQKGKPWVGYYWAPTWILGTLDMVMLKGSEFPVTQVNILVNAQLPKRAPEVVDFLKKYQTTMAQNNKLLAIMQKNEYNADQAAAWFIKNQESTWTSWVTTAAADRIRETFPADKILTGN